MPESLLVSICAAGRRGVPIRDLFAGRTDLDSDLQNWLWQQLLQTSAVVLQKGDEVLDLPDSADYEQVAEDDQIHVVASEMQREVYLGIHQRSYFLSNVQKTLLEAIGRSQAAGGTRAEIDALLKDDPLPNKEFFRHCKTLLTRNLIVRLNTFSTTPRIGKYAPPTAYPRWFLRRFIQLPLPARSWTVASTSAATQQQSIERRHHIDTEVVPHLLAFLSDHSPDAVSEPDLHSFAEQKALLNDLDWTAVRERLFATHRVCWDYVETEPGQFSHGFRIVGPNDAGPADIPIEDALMSRDSDNVLSLDLLMTPQIAQIYRLIDASGSSGILTLTLFRQLHLMQRRGHKILGELSRLPGDDAVVQVADRHKTSLVYRLYRKGNMLQNSSTGTIKVQSRSSRRQSRSEDVADDEEDESDDEEESGKVIDSFFMRRLRWIRDIVAVRKAVNLTMLCHIIRHREIASVASCAMKSISRLCSQLEADGDIVQRHIHPDNDDTLAVPVTVAIDAEYLASFPEEAEVKIEDAARLDPRSEYDLRAQNKSLSIVTHSTVSNDTYMIAYPILCGFVRMRLVRAKLLHLHLASITLESRPHVRHWYLYDVFLSMPLTLYLMIAGAFESMPRDVIFDERLLSLPIRQQALSVQTAIMTALLDGIQYPSLRVQDILEILQRLGLVRLWMPAAHPATWQITVHLDSLVPFPDIVFDCLDSIHQFWIDLRMHCKAMFISENHNKIVPPGVDDPGPVNTDLLERLPANLFPELYTEVNWFAGHELSESKQEALEALDHNQRIDTEETLNEACEQVNLSTGKAAWFLAQLHFEFVREFCKTIDVTDNWRPDPVLRRRERIDSTPLDANRNKRRRRSSVADDAKTVEGTPSRRRNDLRSRLYLRGLSPEPRNDQVDLTNDGLIQSPAADRSAPVRSVRNRRLSRKADSAPTTPAESEPVTPSLLRKSWTESLFDAAKRIYTSDSKRQREDITLLSQEPRLVCILTTIKMILLQPDKDYNAEDGKIALKDFTDNEVEWAFKILSAAHLAVLRKNTPGSKAARGHFTISAKARDHHRHPTYPLSLRDSLRNQCFVRTSANSCKPEFVAVSVSLASTGICKIDSDDRTVLLEVDDLAMSAIVDAYDGCIGTNQYDLNVYDLPSSELSDEICSFIQSSEADGVGKESISTMFPGDAAVECLHWLTACDRVFVIDCFSERRYVHESHSSIYVINNVIRKSWVLLNGELNEELLRNLQWMIITYLCDKPGTERDVLANLVPYLSPLEFDALIHCMVLDGTIWSRQLVLSQPMMLDCVSVLAFDSRVRTVFFASADSLIRCC